MTMILDHATWFWVEHTGWAVAAALVLAVSIVGIISAVVGSAFSLRSATFHALAEEYQAGQSFDVQVVCSTLFEFDYVQLHRRGESLKPETIPDQGTASPMDAAVDSFKHEINGSPCMITVPGYYIRAIGEYELVFKSDSGSQVSISPAFRVLAPEVDVQQSEGHSHIMWRDSLKISTQAYITRSSSDRLHLVRLNDFDRVDTIASVPVTAASASRFASMLTGGSSAQTDLTEVKNPGCSTAAEFLAAEPGNENRRPASLAWSRVRLQLTAADGNAPPTPGRYCVHYMSATAAPPRSIGSSPPVCVARSREFIVHGPQIVLVSPVRAAVAGVAASQGRFLLSESGLAVLSETPSPVAGTSSEGQLVSTVRPDVGVYWGGSLCAWVHISTQSSGQDSVQLLRRSKQGVLTGSTLPLMAAAQTHGSAGTPPRPWAEHVDIFPAQECGSITLAAAQAHTQQDSDWGELLDMACGAFSGPPAPPLFIQETAGWRMQTGQWVPIPLGQASGCSAFDCPGVYDVQYRSDPGGVIGGVRALNVLAPLCTLHEKMPPRSLQGVLGGKAASRGISELTPAAQEVPLFAAWYGQPVFLRLLTSCSRAEADAVALLRCRPEEALQLHSEQAHEEHDTPVWERALPSILRVAPDNMRGQAPELVAEVGTNPVPHKGSVAHKEAFKARHCATLSQAPLVELGSDFRGIMVGEEVVCMPLVGRDTALPPGCYRVVLRVTTPHRSSMWGGMFGGGGSATHSFVTGGFLLVRGAQLRPMLQGRYLHSNVGSTSAAVESSGHDTAHMGRPHAYLNVPTQFWGQDISVRIARSPHMDAAREEKSGVQYHVALIPADLNLAEVEHILQHDVPVGGGNEDCADTQLVGGVTCSGVLPSAWKQIMLAAGVDCTPPPNDTQHPGGVTTHPIGSKSLQVSFGGMLFSGATGNTKPVPSGNSGYVTVNFQTHDASAPMHAGLWRFVVFHVCGRAARVVGASYSLPIAAPALRLRVVPCATQSAAAGGGDMGPLHYSKAAGGGWSAQDPGIATDGVVRYSLQDSFVEVEVTTCPRHDPADRIAVALEGGRPNVGDVAECWMVVPTGSNQLTLRLAAEHLPKVQSTYEVVYVRGGTGPYSFLRGGVAEEKAVGYEVLARSSAKFKIVGGGTDLMLVGPASLDGGGPLEPPMPAPAAPPVTPDLAWEASEEHRRKSTQHASGGAGGGYVYSPNVTAQQGEAAPPPLIMGQGGGQAAPAPAPSPLYPALDSIGIISAPAPALAPAPAPAPAPLPAARSSASPAIEPEQQPSPPPAASLDTGATALEADLPEHLARFRRLFQMAGSAAAERQMTQAGVPPADMERVLGRPVLGTFVPKPTRRKPAGKKAHGRKQKGVQGDDADLTASATSAPAPSPAAAQGGGGGSRGGGLSMMELIQAKAKARQKRMSQGAPNVSSPGGEVQGGAAAASTDNSTLLGSVRASMHMAARRRRIAGESDDEKPVNGEGGSKAGRGGSAGDDEDSPFEDV